MRPKRIVALLSLGLLFTGCSEAPVADLPSFAVESLEIIVPKTGPVSVGANFSSVIASRAPIGTLANLTAKALPDGATFNDRGDGTALFAWQPTNEQIGKHVVRITAEASGDTIDAEWLFEVVGGENIAPVWSAPAELWLLTGFSSELTISATDANEDALTAELVSGPPGVTLLTDPLRLEFNILTPGAFPVALKISDGDATIEVTIWLHVQSPGNYAPVFSTEVTWVTLTGGAAWSLPLVVTDKNQDPISFTVQGATGMFVVDGELRWLPPHHGFGQIVATVAASDGVTVSTHQITFVVNDALNTAPILPARGITNTGQGGLLKLLVPAVDAENDAISYAVSATMPPNTPVPGFAASATGMVTWGVPAAFNTANRVYVTVQATDDYYPAANASRKYTVQVFANNPPTINAVGPTTAERGVAFSMAFTASDPDFGDVPFLEAVTLPVGMTLTQNPFSTSYLLEWTPINEGGEIVVGIRAVDPHGSVTYWTPGKINIANRTPEIAATFPLHFMCLGASQNFTVTGQDDDGDTIFWSSNGSDIRFWGDPVTGGSMDFNDYMRPASNTIILLAEDRFGGSAYASKKYQVMGWRNVTEIPNRISISSGSKSSPLLASMGANSNVAGESIVSWIEHGGGQYERLYVQRISALGCPKWNSGTPSSGDDLHGDKKLRAISVNPTSTWATFSLSPGINRACDESGGYLNGLAVSGIRNSDGAFLESVCIDKSNNFYAGTVRLTGSPTLETHLLAYGRDSENTLRLLMMKSTSSGAISSTTFSRTYSDVDLSTYSTNVNLTNRFVLAWLDTGDGTTKTVTLSPLNVEEYAPVTLDLNAENIRTALFANGRSLILYSQTRYLKFQGINDNGSLSTIAGTDTIGEAALGNDIGSDSHLIAEPSSDSVSFAYASWSNAGQIFSQSIGYNSSNNTTMAFWNAGNSPIQLSTTGVNKNPRAVILDDKLMVTWEQEVGAQVIPMARVLDRTTGALLSDPLVVSTQPVNAITSMVPLGTGIGVSFIDYSHDALQGDVALSYMGINGNSRP